MPKKLSTNISINIKEDFRKFKAGETINIELQPLAITYIAGSNGSGKSTILQALRLQRDKLAETNKHRADGLRPQSLNTIESTVLPKIEISGFDFDEIYALDAVIDDPQSMENSCTAVSFMENGGYQLQRASKGEKAIFMLDRFIKDIQSFATTEPNDNTRLIILDEIDEGLDLKYQVKFNTILQNIAIKYFASILVVSHNTLCMLSDCFIKPKIYDLDNKKMTTIDDYISYKTNGEYKIIIETIKS